MHERFHAPFSQEVSSLEEMRQRVLEKIKVAKDHALDVASEGDFIQRYSDMCDMEWLPNPPPDFDPLALREMEARVLQAIAKAETLVEFRILLENVGMSAEEAVLCVEHENAHVNVTEQKDTHVFRGYGVIFFKEGEEIVSAQPVALSDKKDGVNMVSFLEDKIEILKAPDLYGNETSEDDKREIEKVQNILKLHKGILSQ